MAHIINHTIKLTDYLEIDITDNKFDDVEDAVIIVDADFSVDVRNFGIFIDAAVKSVKWSYTGVNFTDDEDTKSELEGVSDETWEITSETSSDDDNDSCKLFLNDVSINMETKKIHVNFKC